MTGAGWSNDDHRFDVLLTGGLAAEGWFYEMCRGGNTFEVKNDRVALETSRVYVETHHQPGRVGDFKPSGINTTEAACWIFALGDPVVSFVGIETGRLKGLARLSRLKAEQPNGSCPTRGRLVTLGALLSNGGQVAVAA